MLKVNNKVVYLHKDTIKKEELYNYISRLYIDNKEKIIELFKNIEKRLYLEYFNTKVETETKIIDIKRKLIIYKLKDPIFVKNKNEIIERKEEYEEELSKYGILDFNSSIPNEYLFKQIKNENYYIQRKIFENGKIRISNNNFQKILMNRNNNYEIYNIEFEMFTEEEGNSIIFPIKEISLNTNATIEILNLLIERKNGKFYIFDRELDISKNLANMMFFNIIGMAQKGTDEYVVIVKNVKGLRKLIEKGEIIFEKGFLEDKILEEENDKSKIEYLKPNLKDMNLGLWSIYDKRKFSKSEDFRKVYSDESIYGENPLNNVDKNAQVLIEFDNEMVRVLIKDSDGRIYPKSIFSKRNEDSIENLSIMKFCNIKKFLEDYEKFESRPNTSKNDILFSYDAFKEYENTENKENFYWIDFQNPFKNTIYLEEIDKEINLIEIFAYTLGLYLNNEIDKKIFLRYSLSFSNIRTKEELDFIKYNFEKGIRKSIPTSVLKDKVMSKYKVEYRVENTTSLLAGILSEQSSKKIEISDIPTNYIVLKLDKNEYTYSMGYYKKILDNERYDLEINKKVANGFLNKEFDGKEFWEIQELIWKKLEILFLDIENNKNIFSKKVKIIFDVMPEFKDFVIGEVFKKMEEYEFEIDIIEIFEGDKIVLENGIELNKNFFKVYGLLLCQRSGWIKMYKEKIVDEEEFLYKVGIKRNEEFQVLLDNNSEEEWIKTLSADEKEICLNFMNKKGEIYNLILEIERSYADADIFIKSRGKDTIDYTVINKRGQQLEEIRTEVLD
ncbi:hypothetical protein BCB68_09550 [Leptotrichia sp. oral taxon 498]|uniref:hypothetical protein n=1 Tax=Leptotrichia sp. oral taxon 498 TaxID=712368 RepID=UPI000B8CD81D|nr:hypothetical protein [Leptotrichia sp. oral taxon 498]ASQ49145.1 hypothetical protein BCB68_09550 [Leptotrichia sp. oral taxon 498]